MSNCIAALELCFIILVLMTLSKTRTFDQKNLISKDKQNVNTQNPFLHVEFIWEYTVGHTFPEYSLNLLCTFTVV